MDKTRFSSLFILQARLRLYMNPQPNGTYLLQVHYASSKTPQRVSPPAPQKASKTKKALDSKMPLPAPQKTILAAANSSCAPLIQRSSGTATTPKFRDDKEATGSCAAVNRSGMAAVLPLPIAGNKPGNSQLSASYRAPTLFNPSRWTASTRKPKPDASSYVIYPGDSQTMTLPDGSKLGYAVFGSLSPKALPVVCFHGTPGSRLSFFDLHIWAEKNDIRMICPERPGYGLSTFKKNYTVREHAQDVQLLMHFLGFRPYKIHAVSGGAAYGLALNHLAAQGDILGTILVAPATPAEASRVGQSFKRFLNELWILLFPASFEWFERKRGKKVIDFYAKNTWSDAKHRKTKKGMEYLMKREQDLVIKGYVYDYRNTDRYWGFELGDVKSAKIVIFAGGLDHDTPLAGVQYMRNHLKNSPVELVIKPLEDHLTLQNQYGWQALQVLRQM